MKKQYVIRGTGSKGEPVFLNYDSSGGYPYASTYMRDTFTLDRAIQALDDASNGHYDSMHNPEICEIQFAPISADYVIEHRKQQVRRILQEQGISIEELRDLL